MLKLIIASVAVTALIGGAVVLRPDQPTETRKFTPATIQTETTPAPTNVPEPEIV